MSDDDVLEPKYQLGSAAEFMAEVKAEQKYLKEVFEKHMGIAWVLKSAGNYEQMVESYIRATCRLYIFQSE